MSHYYLIIILPPDTTDPLAVASALLAPYKEAPDNPTSYWDYWRVGGTWDGYMKYGEWRESRGGLYQSKEHEQLRHNTCRVRAIKQPERPFAALTPDGTWEGYLPHPYWREGVLGPRRWRSTWAALKARYADHLALALDCHI